MITTGFFDFFMKNAVMIFHFARIYAIIFDYIKPEKRANFRLFGFNNGLDPLLKMARVGVVGHVPYRPKEQGEHLA